VLPSLKVPVEVNCSVAPSTIDEFAGATAIDTKIAGETVSVSLPLTEAEATVIVAEPTAWAVTTPVALTVAMLDEAEDQVAELVMFCWVPSLKVAIALSCCVLPFGTERLCGLTAIATRTAGETVRVALPLTDAEAAVIVAEPTAWAVTTPVALTVAMPD
jgi:hypothetical protein